MTSELGSPTKSTGNIDQVDVRGPRFAAWVTTAVLVITLIVSSRSLAAAAVILGVQAVVFAIGAIAGVQRHPYGIVYRKLIRPRLKPPTELEDPKPPTFAQGVGLFVSVVGLVLALLGVPLALPIAAAAAFVAAFLNSVFDYCLGCQIYLLLVRAKVIRTA